MLRRDEGRASEEAVRPGAVVPELDQGRREIVGEALALGLVGRAQDPEQQEKGHHRRHEIGIGDLPGAAVMTAMAFLDDLLDADRARLGLVRSEEAPVGKVVVSTWGTRWS